MCEVLYSHLKTNDGCSLFCEIDKKVAMLHVESVIPNTLKAENMVEMMNQNMMGYLRN